MAAQVLPPPGQHDRRLAVTTHEQRNEHRRIGTAVNIERGRLDRVEEDAFQQLAQISARA
jgi:hypothetical protein